MTPITQAISGALIQFIWQGFFVSLAVAAAMFLLRKQSPQLRYVIGCAALLTLAALPLITAVALYDPYATNHPGPAAVTLTIRSVWNGSLSPTALSVQRWLDRAQPWMLQGWILGVAFLSIRLAWLGARISQLRKSGGPANSLTIAMATALARRMGTRRKVRILVSAIPDGAAVVGWIRPVILLPAAILLNLTSDQLEAILAHEIAHLRRYDDVVNIAQSAIETLLFYHPAVWWISNRVRHERELCCDDLAVRASGNALCYARALTALEKLRVARPALSVAALGTVSSPLEYRIRRIVDSPASDYRPSTLPGILALSLAAVCLAIYSSPAIGSAPPPAHAEYPESARINGIQGTVPVEVKIDYQGVVSDAKAIGGPKELRQAAVKAVSSQRFTHENAPGTELLDVDFQLAASAPAPLPSKTPVTAPAPRIGPVWRDRAESSIGLAATNEQDSAKQLDLLKTWEQQYPVSEFHSQRTAMMSRALLAVMESAYGKTDPAVLDAGRKAGQQLADHVTDYFSDPLARKNGEMRLHLVFAWIARTEHDDVTAEAELKKALIVNPEDAGTSYQLGETILREIATNNELTRYSEAFYDLARSLTVTGPTALPPEMKTAAELALKESYGNYHGNTEGLDELLKQVGASALPPADFHIASFSEQWAAAHPELVLWQKTKSELLARHSLPETVSSLTFHATVVSQLSANRILVNVDNTPAGDAVVRFDASHMNPARPGTQIQFTGVIDSYKPDPYVVTFVIRNPTTDLVGLNSRAQKQGNILTRAFKGIARLIRHLA